jgi:hypothetical protein
MSATRLEVTLRVAGREVFTVEEAPGATSELQRTVNVGNSTTLTAQLGATSTPKVDRPPIALKITLAGSPTTINLAAIAGVALPATATRLLDFTGARLVALSLLAPASNAAAVQVAPGASAPYPLFGAGLSIAVEPGEAWAKCFSGIASNKPPVSGSARNIDVSGNVGDVLFLDLYLGT